MRSKYEFATDVVEDDVMDIRVVLDFLDRRWKFIFGTAATVLALSLLVLFTLTPRYTSAAQVLVDPSLENIPGLEAIRSELTLDSPTIDSQVSLIQSRSLLERVVVAESLTEDPEFGARSGSNLFSVLRSNLSNVLGRSLSNLPGSALFGVGTSEQAPATVTKTAATPLDTGNTIERLRERLDVSRVGATYVINIAITSEDSEKAARIANAIANAYVVDELDIRIDAALRTSDWLSERLQGLQVELRESEEAVEQFRIRNGLIATNTGTVNQQQLSELNHNLILVRAEAAERRARYEQAQQFSADGVSLQTIPDVLSSLVILNLRQQQTEVSRRLADLASRYGPRHPQLVNAQAEEMDINRAITAEVTRIIANLKNDYEVAQSREQSLQQSLVQLTSKAGTDNEVTIELNELERRAAANVALYEAFLARSKLTEEEGSFETQNIRIISLASISEAPSYPRKKLIAGLALVLGLGLGTGGAYLRERLSSGFATPYELEAQLGLPVLAATPLLRAREIESGQRSRPDRYLLKNPLSRYSESIRSLRSSLELSDAENPPKVILVTSALPREGKTTLAISLAQSAASADRRVLLLDCDLRHPSIESTFGLRDCRYGLVDVLTGVTEPEHLIHRDNATGIYILTAGTKSQNPPDLLGSQRMEQLLAGLREIFDLVVIDGAPVEPVIDSPIVARYVDKVVFAIRWSTTDREVVARALQKFPGDNKVLGTVLTMLDERKTPRYGPYSYYRSSHYGDYYS